MVRLDALELKYLGQIGLNDQIWSAWSCNGGVAMNPRQELMVFALAAALWVMGCQEGLNDTTTDASQVADTLGADLNVPDANHERRDQNIDSDIDAARDGSGLPAPHGATAVSLRVQAP